MTAAPRPTSEGRYYMLDGVRHEVQHEHFADNDKWQTCGWGKWTDDGWTHDGCPHEEHRTVVHAGALGVWPRSKESKIPEEPKATTSEIAAEILSNLVAEWMNPRYAVEGERRYRPNSELLYRITEALDAAYQRGFTDGLNERTKTSTSPAETRSNQP